MKQILIYVLTLFTSLLFSCGDQKSTEPTEEIQTNQLEQETETPSTHIKPFNTDLPTIGLLIYDGVLITEVTATADVFSKPTAAGIQLFNVITIAENNSPIASEEGLRILSDYTFENCPKLDVIFVPSAYDMYTQVHNPKIVDFIREKNNETQYTVSNCAGAQLIGASGIADGKKIVTWIGGGKQLQEDYPNLIVQDDSLVSFVEDGKFSSSNGNLASYISALKLLEKMTDAEQRAFVESYIYLDRLRNWKE